jgi:hypothetical protein
MNKRDVLDEDLARRLAWRTSAPDTPSPSSEPPSTPPPSETPEEIAAREAGLQDFEAWWQEGLDHGEARCAELVARIREVWAMTSAAEQAAAIPEMVALAGSLAAFMTNLQEHRLESLRFWRLLARHLRPGRVRHRRERMVLEWLVLPVEIDEVVDLVVEAAQQADPILAGALDHALAGEEGPPRQPELGPRLVRVVDEGPTWKARALAARWLAYADSPEVVPALRRALRRPHAVLRGAALMVLEKKPGALREEDLLWLLEDAAEHPVPRPRDGEDPFDVYEKLLSAAVIAAPPAEGYRPLERILGRGARILKDGRVVVGYEGFDASWALITHAAAYPARALARVARQRAAAQAQPRRAAATLNVKLGVQRLLKARRAAAPPYWQDTDDELTSEVPTDQVPTRELSEDEQDADEQDADEQDADDDGEPS